MSDSFKAAHDDEREYVRLCKKYGQTPHKSNSIFTIDYAHLEELRNLDRSEIQENEKIDGEDIKKAQKEEYLVLCKKYNEYPVYIRNEFGESQLDINSEHHNYLYNIHNGKRYLECYVCRNEKESTSPRKFKKSYLVDQDESKEETIRINICNDCYIDMLETGLISYGNDCIHYSIFESYLSQQYNITED